MNYSIIAIGDELLLGQVTDTNSGAIARMLDPIGWQCTAVEVIHDDPAAIREALDRALARTDVVLMTGGLGPTKDDITKATLAEYFGGGMHLDPEQLANLTEVMAANGRELNELTRAQAIVPDACTPLRNRVGTAPIMWFELDGKVAVSMPGVPHETLTAMREQVMPRLQQRFPSPLHLGHRVAIVGDISESMTAMTLAPWEESLPDNLHLAYLPKARLIRLRLDGRGADPVQLDKQLDEEFAKMQKLLGKHLLATSDITPAEALIEALRAKGLTMCTAESCTGGNIAHSITLVPGCSDVMRGGVVAYSNEVKTDLLGVEEATLDRHGAVSRQVVKEMLLGAISATDADLAVATSGIAGPSGGTPEKPVGTVVVGAMLMKPDGSTTASIETLHFKGDRSRVIDGATTAALTAALHLIAGRR